MKKLFINILSAFVFDKKKRRRFRNQCKILFGLKNKIRVCFLVTENQKWKSQELFDALKKDKIFDVFAVYAPRNTSNHQQKSAVDADVEFFKSRVSPLYIGYDVKTNKYEDLKKFKPDVVFYTQPWDIPEIHSVAEVSKFAKTAYIPYGVANAVTPMRENLDRFYYHLWRYYTAHKLINKQYVEKIPYVVPNLKAVGYPVLNEIMNCKTKHENMVIYAPHPIGNTWVNYWTFEWNGEQILEYAKKHPEVHWVFKPHPDFRWAGYNHLGKDFIDKYYDEWAKIGDIYEKGDYYGLFQKSRCLITDCGSFITEYFVTGNPVIHLRNPKATDYNGLNDVVKEVYYKVWNQDELKKVLDLIIEQKQDPLKQKRKILFDELGLEKLNASRKIIKDLKRCFLK